MDELYLAAEIAEKCQIPENTVRRYCKNFKEYIPSKKYGRATRYSADSINILQNISALYSKGHTTLEIQDLLRGQYPQTVELEEKNLPVGTIQQIATALDKLASQEKEINELKQKVQKMEEYQTETLDKRDQRLMETMRKMIDEKGDKLPWWKKIFKKA